MYKALVGEPITIWGDGSVVRDYIFVADLADGLLALPPPVSRRRESAHLQYRQWAGAFPQGHPGRDRSESRTTLKVEYTAGRAFDIPVNVVDVGLAKRALGCRHAYHSRAPWPCRWRTYATARTWTSAIA